VENALPPRLMPSLEAIIFAGQLPSEKVNTGEDASILDTFLHSQFTWIYSCNQNFFCSSNFFAYFLLWTVIFFFIMDGNLIFIFVLPHILLYDFLLDVKIFAFFF
jgi:hypothetical protein